jgi:SAM-dependent methyltransferase
MPSSEYLEQIYAKYHKSQEEGGRYNRVEVRVALDFDEKIRRIKKAVGHTDIRLLDVGCGKGFFVQACREYGIDASGLDLSSTAVGYAVQQLHLPAICGRIEDCEDRIEPVDVVTLWATIEHLTNPVETLKAIRRILRPGGRLFLDTGVGHDWLDRLLPGCVQWYAPPLHLFVFSTQGIGILLEKAGFLVVHIDSCFERSPIRRWLRIIRNGAAAFGLRAVTTLIRLNLRHTRFPLGNLMFIEAVAGNK